VETLPDVSGRIAGKAAARWLSVSWPEIGDEPERPTFEWAAGAIEELGAIQRSAPAIHRASMRRGQTAAASLSPRPFQGILECVQNADDLGATELRVMLRREPRRELLIVHDGRPVTLADAAAMSLPWVTTKAEDHQSSGRFGIGQQTLRALGDTIVVHSPPFHFELHDDGPRVSPAADGMRGAYDPEARETMVVVTLREAVGDDDVADAVAELGVRSLMFLRTVRRIVFQDVERPERDVSFALRAHASETRKLLVAGLARDVEHLKLEVTEPVVSAGQVYERYWTQQPVHAGSVRLNKATGEMTPLGLCICRTGADEASLYDRVPLPVKLGFPMSLNAQFDPDSARTTILKQPWNTDRIGDLGKLVAAAALFAFDHEPTRAWLHVPLHSEQSVPDWLGAMLDESVVDECHRRISDDLALPTDAGPKPLPQIVYPAESLEALLTVADLRLLDSERFALSDESRDAAGRWRDVLGELGQTRRLDVSESLELFEHAGHLQGRNPAWFVEMAAVAAHAGLFTAFLTRPSIVLADGRLVSCPSANSSSILVEEADEETLAFHLGVVLKIHPAYMATTESAALVRTKLREASVLVERRDEPFDALQLLARRGDSGSPPLRVTDTDVVELRDAWARLSLEQRASLSARIGQSIAVRVITHRSSGKVEETWGRPCDAYLPSAIDREQLSFAKAAGTTPGLSWIDPSYTKLLKTKRQSTDVGAQRLFVALGALREPRLIAPSPLEPPGKRDRRVGSAISAIARPKLQVEALKSMIHASHLLDDRWSPDLEAVVVDIRKAPTRTRVKRALALLSVLSRNWDRHYSDFSTALAVFASDGKWWDIHPIVSTWLARLSEAAWLPNRSNVLKAPVELLLPTKSRAERSRKDLGALLADVEPSVLRSGILAALGLRTGPSASDLVDGLRRAQMEPVTSALTQRVYAEYQELAEMLVGREESGARTMSAAQLRSAFDASSSRRGLILANGQWHAPQAVLRGPPVFGSFRTFAPNIENLDVLWNALNVREPSLDDCIDVLRTLAGLKPTTEREGIMIATLRTMVSKLATAPPQSLRLLRRFPLFTGTGWSRERPAYLAEASIAAALPSDLMMWRPGLTSSSELEPLANALGVTRLRLQDFSPRFSAANVAGGEENRRQFVATVGLLRDSLARDDIALHDSLRVTWNELHLARFVIDPELEICHELTGGRVLTVPTGAHMTAEPLLFVARTLDDGGSAASGGAAVASLFSGDRQKVAWAWGSCWIEAAAGNRASAIILPPTKPEAAAKNHDRLTDLRNDARSRPAKGAGTAASRASNGAPQPSPLVRKLRDVSNLLPDDGSIVNSGATKRGIVFANAAKSNAAGRTYSPSAAGQKASPEKDVLPSGGVREDLALDAVRRALRRNPEQIRDIRHRRGLGADAVDELQQCYEIKMSSSTALPQEVSLTESEVHAAQTDPDFFLAIVTGLEEGEGELRVRFIFDPLNTLSVRFKGDLTLTGIPEAEALEFRFGPDTADS
jgi:hypothetical protein